MSKFEEQGIQRAIVAYLRLVMPHAIVHHNVSEGNRGGIKGLADGKRKKAMGQLPGYPDIICLPWANVGPLWFEVKTKTGRVSKAQKEMHKAMIDLGYKVAVVRNINDVRAFLIANHIGFSEKILGFSEKIPMKGTIK